MCRQIQINSTDIRYQLIYERDNPEGALNCYKLNTVTYGTTAAPYLAVKRLQTLADQNVDKYPLAAKTTKEDFYVDDLIHNLHQQQRCHTAAVRFAATV